MRKLTTASLLLLLVIISPGETPSASAFKYQSPKRAPLTIDAVLTLTAHEKLQPLATARVDELAALLKQVVYEDSARRIAPAAERCFLEIELLNARSTMLPALSRAEKIQFEPLQQEFEAARTRLTRQCVRLSASPNLTRHLPYLVRPLRFDRSARAKAEVLLSQLQTLRSQIELYKLQHRDNLPDFRKSGWKSLTRPTNINGEFDRTSDYGPYLHSPPDNPLNGSSAILLISGKPRPDLHLDPVDCGFAIDQTTGRIWGIDADGRIFDENIAQADLR